MKRFDKWEDVPEEIREAWERGDGWLKLVNATLDWAEKQKPAGEPKLISDYHEALKAAYVEYMNTDSPHNFVATFNAGILEGWRQAREADHIGDANETIEPSELCKLLERLVQVAAVVEPQAFKDINVTDALRQVAVLAAMKENGNTP